MEIKKILHLALFLAIVSALAGAVIGLANEVTSPIIAGNDIAAEKANLELMYPNGEFAAVDYSGDDSNILGIYSVSGEGYVIKASATGYNTSTPIIVLIGFDESGTTTAIQVLQQQETSGIGSKVFEADWLNSTYVGKTSSDSIDTMSGATFSSTAMQNIMASAFEAIAGLGA